MGSPPFSFDSKRHSSSTAHIPEPDQHSPQGGVVAVIPARYASVRFPGKVLADLHGWPLLRYVWERACAIEGLDRVLIATDDDRVEAAAQEFGAEVARTRKDHRSGSDRVGEVAQALDPAPGFVLNLQGDEPLLPAAAVERMVTYMRRMPDAIWTLAHPVDTEEEWSRPSVVKVVCDTRGRALYFSRAPIPHTREDSRQPGTGALRHIGVYGFPRPLLRAFLALPPTELERREGLEQLRALESGLKMHVAVAEAGSPGVDVPADLQHLAERYPNRDALLRAGDAPKSRTEGES